MSEEKIMIYGLLRHYCEKDISAKAAAKEICAIEGESIIYRNTAALGFRHFSNGNMRLSDEPRRGRPSVVDGYILLERVKQDPHATICDLSAIVGSF